MGLLHSWCCWRSVRKGSFVCGIYTAIYYTITVAHSSAVLHQELDYLSNCSTDAKQSTFLDHDTTSSTSMTFTIIIIIISSCGVLTSGLLLYGLYIDCKILLIPWITNMLIFIAEDMIYVCYNFVEHALKLNPLVAILITIDLFINTFNIYALLCVISQYQELKEGRGTSMDDQNNVIPNIHYSSHPTATSYLSTKKAVTYHETRPTPTQSPTATCPAADDPISSSLFNKGPRKSVKFPDHSTPTNNHHNGSQLLEPWTIEVKSPLMTKGTDTAPLIESTATDTILQSNL